MPRPRLMSAMLLVLVLTAAGGCRRAPEAAPAAAGGVAGTPAPLSDADLAAIRANDSAFAAAATAGDVDGVVATYAADGSLLPPNAPAIKGADGIRSFWGGFMTAFALKMELAETEIGGAGDLAYVVGRYRFTATPKAEGAGFTDQGKFVEVYKRQPDGGWRYAVDIYNSDLPVK